MIDVCRSKDSAVLQDPEGDGQIVYLFLPLYKVCVEFLMTSHLPYRLRLLYFFTAW